MTAQALFQATRRKVIVDPRQDPLIQNLPSTKKAAKPRRAADWYPTAESDAIRALLTRDGDRIRACYNVWEPACGSGHLVRVLRSSGLKCSASDLHDRGCPDSWLADFYSCSRSRGEAMITNPPFSEITARDGHGRWLKHMLDMPGWTYSALLLDWNWPAGRINGLGELLDSQPFTRAYLMRWKLDFSGAGQPPQRNAWFIFDRKDPRSYDGKYPEPGFCFLDRIDERQGGLL
jgi:hypothetical protein